ncbi:hypothetical protein ABW19_dt0202147 [Dactylella cylindrospora]|nr:hypothetical protein ABW19_dt0202147 [Dactylella cylindrospora]
MCIKRVEYRICKHIRDYDRPICPCSPHCPCRTGIPCLHDVTSLGKKCRHCTLAPRRAAAAASWARENLAIQRKPEGDIQDEYAATCSSFDGAEDEVNATGDLEVDRIETPEEYDVGNDGDDEAANEHEPRKRGREEEEEATDNSDTTLVSDSAPPPLLTRGKRDRSRSTSSVRKRGRASSRLIGRSQAISTSPTTINATVQVLPREGKRRRLSAATKVGSWQKIDQDAASDETANVPKTDLDTMDIDISMDD